MTTTDNITVQAEQSTTEGLLKNQSVCPACGYCPCCGRGGQWTGQAPWYPQPYYPWPYPTWGATATGGSVSTVGGTVIW